MSIVYKCHLANFFAKSNKILTLVLTPKSIHHPTKKPYEIEPLIKFKTNRIHIYYLSAYFLAPKK